MQRSVFAAFLLLTIGIQRGLARVISNDLLQALKDGYKQRIKWVLISQMALFITVAVILVSNFVTKFSFNQLSFIFVLVSISSLLSGVEHLLLKREKWQWIFDFILAAFLLVYLFFTPLKRLIQRFFILGSSARNVRTFLV